ncbi:MAG: hypothetical protein J7L04_01875 [Bacteroidales bacterium]|nr:hypothetical protein [Bacteroidales bacterium]
MGVITTGCTKENSDKIKESNELTDDELPNIAHHPKKGFGKVTKYHGWEDKIEKITPF